MKKSLIFVGMLAIGYANAQEGNVGINTDQPKATLDIQPNATNLAGTTNQGILAPRLSKARVANIETPVQGTLVYVLDESSTEYPNSLISAYTGADAKVAKITEKGYYFYNGTEWVKAGANGELWAQRDNAGVTETYLKPANDKADFIGYRSDRKWSINLGNVQEDDLRWGDNSNGFVVSEVPVSTLVSSDLLPKNSTIGGNTYFYFSNDNYLLKNEHIAQNNRYVGKEHRFIAKDITTSINSIAGLNSTLDIFSNTNVETIAGLKGMTAFGSEQHKNGTTIHNNAGEFITRNYATSTNMYGAKFSLYNNGKADNLRGIQINNSTQNKVNNITPNHTVKSVSGIENYTNLSDNGTVTENIHSSYNQLTLGNNTTIGDNANVRGMFSRIISQQTATPIKTLVNYMSMFSPTGTVVDRYEDFTAYPNLRANAQVKDYIGFRVAEGNIDATATIENMYGINVGNISKGTNNFAIHTGAGKVRVGDLADSSATADRVVTVDANGVLKTGVANTGVKAGTTAETCSDANLGAIHFKEVEISGTSPVQKKGVFGFCTKQNDTAMWVYLSNGGNIMQGTGTFGQGL